MARWPWGRGREQSRGSAPAQQAAPPAVRRLLIGTISGVATGALVAWMTGLPGWVWDRITRPDPVTVNVLPTPAPEPTTVSPSWAGAVGLVNSEWREDPVWAIPGDFAPESLPPPEQLNEWASLHGGFHPYRTVVYFAVQGKSPNAVVLTGMQIEVKQRSKPPDVTTVDPCWRCYGEAQPVRAFVADLDEAHPKLKLDPLTRDPANFPYRVSNADPEVFRVTATTFECDCRWTLRLDWSSGGESGSMAINADGKPFRTSAIHEIRRICYNGVDPSRGYADTVDATKAMQICHQG
jgi:hypothetical protein